MPSFLKEMEPTTLHHLSLKRPVHSCRASRVEFFPLATKNRGFLGGSVAKNPPAKQETQVRSQDREDPLEEDIATHSSILALKNLIDRGAWWALVHKVAKSWTQLSN